MTVKVAINGFGRIGRVILRCLAEGYGADVEIVRINSRGSAEAAAHLFKYDSNFGTYAGEVSASDDAITIDGKRYPYTRHADAQDCDWGGVDVLLECSGKFKTRDSNEVHLQKGAPVVLTAYPCSDADTTVVYGVNEGTINKDCKVISNASCTTNCLAPVLSVLHEAYGVTNGATTTVHAYTPDQNLMDGSHSDLRRARAAACSIIPTSTGAARNVGLIIPELNGKMNGYAMRVPVSVVSCIDVSLNLQKSVTVEEVNALMLKASQKKLKGILACNDVPLVSVDFIKNSASSIYDAGVTQVIDGKLLRLLSWYDNEWGFSCRMLDVAAHIKSVA